MAVTLMQVGAGVAGFVSLAFFGLFGGYYFRNRRMAMQLRRAAIAVERADGQTSSTGGEHDGTEPPIQ